MKKKAENFTDKSMVVCDYGTSLKFLKMAKARNTGKWLAHLKGCVSPDSIFFLFDFSACSSAEDCRKAIRAWVKRNFSFFVLESIKKL